MESLIVSVAREALDSAGIEPCQVDEVYLGQFNSGMHPLGFAPSLALQLPDDLAGIPATRVENACGWGSAALHLGIRALLAGTARTVLVIGAEKVTHRFRCCRGSAPRRRLRIGRQRVDDGFRRDVCPRRRRVCGSVRPVGNTLAHIAAKNHRNGALNPYAQLRKDLGFDFCATVSDRNPIVAIACDEPVSPVAFV